MDDKLLFSLPVIIFGVLSILFAGWLAKDVFRRDQGTPEMQKVSNAIFAGALAYLKRQYRTIGLLAIVAAVIMGILVAIFEKDHQTTRDKGAAHIGPSAMVIEQTHCWVSLVECMSTAASQHCQPPWPKLYHGLKIK